MFKRKYQQNIFGIGLAGILSIVFAALMFSWVVAKPQVPVVGGGVPVVTSKTSKRDAADRW